MPALTAHDPHDVTEAIAEDLEKVPEDAGAVASAGTGDGYTERATKKRRSYQTRVVSNLQWTPANKPPTIAAVYINEPSPNGGLSAKTSALGLSAKTATCVALWPI